MPVEINELVIEATVPASFRVIEVEGAEIDAEIDGKLERTVVIDRLQMPDTFTLEFSDPERDVLASAGIEFGKRIKISAGGMYAESATPLIHGEVTSIEAEYSESGSRAIVRGYDLSHRLMTGRRSKTYIQQTYADIAKAIAGENKLQTDIESTPQVHEYVVQANQSDYDFLAGLAREIDFDFRVDGDKMIFKKEVAASGGPPVGDAATTEPTALVWGTTLHEFRARISAVAAVSDVKVRGWDPVKKEAVIGQADTTAGHAELTTKPATLAEKFGSKTLFITTEAVSTQDAADALAKAKAQQVGSAGFEATAVCTGSADIRAGVTISISGVDTAFEGTYTVSSTRHEFGNGNYTTIAECNGRQDRSLTGLIANSIAGGGGGGGGGGQSRQRITGLVVGIVTNIEDPEGLGRVLLKFPWLDDSVESDWARLAMPGAGPDYGLVWVPQVGDEVLVGFEFGDVRRPYVLGGLWNGVDKPPLMDDIVKEGKTRRSGEVSRKGHKLVFEDGPDMSSIELATSDENFSILLDEKNGELKIVAKGKKLVIEAKEVEIKADTDAKLKATNITIEGSAGIALK